MSANSIEVLPTIRSAANSNYHQSAKPIDVYTYKHSNNSCFDVDEPQLMNAVKKAFYFSLPIEINTNSDGFVTAAALSSGFKERLSSDQKADICVWFKPGTSFAGRVRINGVASGGMGVGSEYCTTVNAHSHVTPSVEIFLGQIKQCPTIYIQPNAKLYEYHVWGAVTNPQCVIANRTDKAK